MKLKTFALALLFASSALAEPGNLAPSARISASTQIGASHAAGHVSDGIIGVEDQGEWACQGATNSWGYIRYPWIQLDWEQEASIGKVVLYDRPSAKEHTAGGRLRFSDGSAVSVNLIPNDGTARVVTFAPRRTQWVRFEVTDGDGSELGLSEIEVYPGQGLEKFGSLYGLNLADHLGADRPIRFCNDAEAAIVGEARYGAGAGVGRLLGVTLGTGLGSAFLLNGQPVTAGAGVPPNGWLYDQPARYGTADQTFSIRGVRMRAEQAGSPVSDPSELEDPAVWQLFGDELGRFLLPFVEGFGAQTVLVLGGISAAFPHFGPALNQALGGRARRGQLDAAAPLLGAAALFL